MTAYLAVRNWRRYQHYQDGRPLVWVKFYVSLLDDNEIRGLDPETRLFWDQVLLLAARTDNCIPDAIEELSSDIGIDIAATQKARKILLKGAWLTRFRSRAALDLARARERREEKTPKSPKSSRADTKHAELLTTAAELAADWNGGSSLNFDQALQELEQRCGDRLTALERDDLWDRAYLR